MKALIIGGAGFVGSHLAEHLQNDCNWSVSITKLPHEIVQTSPEISIYDMDILDKDAVITLLSNLRPDYIFHLAAQSSVSLSWKNPKLTVDINITGSIHILDSIRSIENYQPRILLIGSGEEYGHIKPTDSPITEDTTLHPGNIYAVTKTCQNMIGKIYADAYQMNIIMVRAFNHIGPKQLPTFVVSDFCKQVAEIEKGIREPIIYVGNLTAKRDFTDVRDVVRAYSLLIQFGINGETYNVGSGHAVSIETILNTILSLSNISIRSEISSGKLRPVDIPIIEADISKLKSVISWEPIFSLNQTLLDTLAYWRTII